MHAYKRAFSLFSIYTVSSVALALDLHCYTVPTTSQSSASLVKFLSSWQTFSVNGQIFVAATQFCHCNPKAARDNM